MVGYEICLYYTKNGSMFNNMVLFLKCLTSWSVENQLQVILAINSYQQNNGWLFCSNNNDFKNPDWKYYQIIAKNTFYIW